MTSSPPLRTGLPGPVMRITPPPGQEIDASQGRLLPVSLDAFETDHDHAHLLVTYPPKVAMSRLVMSLKTISSMRVRSHGWPEVTKALRGDHFWSPSYAVVSCGGAPLDVVKAYVENQQSPNRSPGRPRRR